jgi:hypothetical protein
MIVLETKKDFLTQKVKVMSLEASQLVFVMMIIMVKVDVVVSWRLGRRRKCRKGERRRRR